MLMSRWYNNQMLPPYPTALKEHIESLGKINNTRIAASYVDDDGDYLAGQFNADFTTPFRKSFD
jgi:hypothetical protein